MESLSDIELYYSDIRELEYVTVTGDEFTHIVKVMRHVIGDEIYITNGRGSIFCTEIKRIDKSFLTAEVVKEYKFEPKFPNVYFCIPKVRVSDRMDFILEKCVELGVTNFIVIESDRTIVKGNKESRWRKIALSAMKQSLQCHIPDFNATELKDLVTGEGRKIVFDQHGKNKVSDLRLDPGIKYYFIFGPEGGLSEEEIGMFDEGDIFTLGSQRLRAETAVIMAAANLPNMK